MATPYQALSLSPYEDSLRLLLETSSCIGTVSHHVAISHHRTTMHIASTDIGICFPQFDHVFNAFLVELGL